MKSIKESLKEALVNEANIDSKVERLFNTIKWKKTNSTWIECKSPNKQKLYKDIKEAIKKACQGGPIQFCEYDDGSIKQLYFVDDDDYIGPVITKDITIDLDQMDQALTNDSWDNVSVLGNCSQDVWDFIVSFAGNLK